MKNKTLNKVLRYIRKYHIYLILSLVFAAISVALTLYVPILVGHAIDCIVGPGDVNFDAIAKLIIKILAAVLVTSLCQWLMNICNNKITYQCFLNTMNGGFSMTIYETIKAAISVKQAAEHYGLKVSHNGMACCPFHNDRHPSLKLNEDYFFCFGCGAKGDVIDLVARLFNMSSYEAAQKLASDFGLDPKPPTAAAMAKPKRPYIRQFREDEMLCFRVLTDYLHLLEDWKVRYAPKTPEDALDDRFVEACQMHCHIEYMADVLTVGDLEERVALVDKLMQDDKIAFLLWLTRT